MDKKLLIVVVASILLAAILIYAISTSIGGQVTGQAVSSGAKYSSPMVGGC